VEGCRKAMQDANLPICAEDMNHGDSHIESVYRNGLALLHSSEPPNAIFSLDNRMTLGIVQALRELKIPCLGFVSLLGSDDCDWAAVFNPALTTIAQPTDETGKRAAELVLQCIRAGEEGVEIEACQILLKSSLRIRGSTEPPPNLIRARNGSLVGSQRY